MENPATWGKAEHIIHDTYEAAFTAQLQGHVGGSIAMQIANALRAEGLLVEEVHSVKPDANWEHGYCPQCQHPKRGYHDDPARGCTMPLDGDGLPSMRTDQTVRSCGCPEKWGPDLGPDLGDDPDGDIEGADYPPFPS